MLCSCVLRIISVVSTFLSVWISRSNHFNFTFGYQVYVLGALVFLKDNLILVEMEFLEAREHSLDV